MMIILIMMIILMMIMIVTLEYKRGNYREQGLERFAEMSCVLDVCCSLYDIVSRIVLDPCSWSLFPFLQNFGAYTMGCF